MDKRQVLILWEQPLLGEAIKNILSQVDDVQVVGLWRLNNRVRSRFADVTPEIVVIVVNEQLSQAITELTTYILKNHSNISVVQVGLHDDQARLYTSHSLPARSADLISVIRNIK